MIFSNYSAKSNNCNDSKALAVGKMKDEMGDVFIEEFAGFKPKVYLILVGDSSKHKKAKDANENVAAKIGQDVFNKKCLRRSMDRIQSKNHNIGTYEINKISLSSFDEKIYIFDH